MTARERLEIREEDADDPCAYAKPFGLHDECLRYAWYNTRAEALAGAHELLEKACKQRDELEKEYYEALDEVLELNLAVLALDADPANK